MNPSRASFLGAAAAAGTVAAAGLPETAVAAPAGADPVAGMTFTMLRDGTTDHLGIRTSRGIIDVALAARALGIASPPMTTDDVIAGRGDVRSLRRILAAAPASAIRSESAVQFAPVVTAPAKIVCVGLNYRAHIAQNGEEVPPYPDLFNKYNTALNRHNGTIAVSKVPGKEFDYETELVMVVGKTAHKVPEAKALDYVFGYTTGNDFTVREVQKRTSQWMTGKTPDEFAPIGPWLVTADQIPDPQTLDITTYVNDETAPRQSSNTAKMIFSCANILSYTSQFITLAPGDIIFTGTPEGVILGEPHDKQVWLKPGDRVRSIISKVGELSISLT